MTLYLKTQIYNNDIKRKLKQRSKDVVIITLLGPCTLIYCTLVTKSNRLKLGSGHCILINYCKGSSYEMRNRICFL